MTSRLTLCLLLVLCASLVLGQEAEKKQDAKEAKPQAAKEAKAQEAKEKPEEEIKYVCGVCECSGEKVDCSGRKLETNLHDHEWPKTPMKLVTFEDNLIKQIEQFPNVTIVRLSFRNNKIEKVAHQSFKYITNLTELDLSENLLTYENLTPAALEGKFAPEVYEPLDKLRVLNLSSNQFHTLNHDLFEHVTDLKALILSNNPFNYFDDSMSVAMNDIPYLEELDLSHCKIKNIDEMSFNSLKYLKKLDLSYNEFSKLPAVLVQIASLEELNLDGNLIEDLGGVNESFPPMPNLKKLTMNFMPKLAALDRGALSNLEALEVLSVQNCSEFSEIDDSAFVKQHEQGSSTWPPLKTLNISNNDLRYIPASLVARWDKLEVFSIANNHLSCDCENQYLIGTLLAEHGQRLMSTAELSNLRCSEPPEHQNRTLKSLAGHKLRCLDLYGARPERDAAVLVGMLIGVLLAVPVVLVLFVLWRRGFLFCGAQGPASFSRAFYRRAPPFDDDV